MNFIVYLANSSTCFPIRFLGNNSLTGVLPSSIGPSIKYLYVCPVPFSFKGKIRKMFIYNIFPLLFLCRDFSYNYLSGNLPSWASHNLQL